MAPSVFRILLALVALYAFTRGKRDERRVGIILVLGVIATHLAISPLHERFEGVETHVMAVDLVVLAGFVWVAIQSERFWPLWIAGLQLTTMFGHVLKALDTELVSQAYGAALVFWGYPIVLILAIGTWRSHHRAQQRTNASA
jgi:hypothetical protein